MCISVINATYHRTAYALRYAFLAYTRVTPAYLPYRRIIVSVVVYTAVQIIVQTVAHLRSGIGTTTVNIINQAVTVVIQTVAYFRRRRYTAFTRSPCSEFGTACLQTNLLSVHTSSYASSIGRT
jgi:hypothetical protein